MVNKLSENQLNQGTNWLGGMIAATGLWEMSGADLQLLVDKVMVDPLKAALIAGLWVVFYTTGKVPGKK